MKKIKIKIIKYLNETHRFGIISYYCKLTYYCKVNHFKTLDPWYSIILKSSLIGLLAYRLPLTTCW